VPPFSRVILSASLVAFLSAFSRAFSLSSTSMFACSPARITALKSSSDCNKGGLTCVVGSERGEEDHDEPPDGEDKAALIFDER